MTNKQILKKAIDKAVKNGWIPKIQWKMNPELYRSAIIFSHDFAELFFGKEWEDGDIVLVPMSEILEEENIKKWQHHLRQMVLKKKPLLYLKKFL